MHELISPTFNLAVLIAVLTYFLRQPIRDYVSGRHHTVRDELARVSELLKDAQEKNSEFSAKLSAIDAEIVAIRKQAVQDAEAMNQRIIANAVRLSAGTVADARLAAEGLYSDLKSELYHELGARVIDRAGSLLKERLTGDDRARIRKEFSSQVEAAQ
ncbi:MAG: ATP synthase F0 subunit B [Oligoflexia bacterium]|nr:ATP synthase F0 subunit B [Oligoflexia bacterium]